MAEIIGFAAWALVLGLVGGLLTEVGDWYRALRKPTWQPPDWLFGPAWTAILAAAAIAGVLAWRAAPDRGGHLAIVALFAVNGLLHLLWSPLFFRWRRPDWALVEVGFLWLSVFALMIGVGRYSATAGWLVLPYFLWVSFASILNRAVVRLNAPFGAAGAPEQASSG